MNLARAWTLLAIMTVHSVAQPVVDPRAFMPKEAHLESRMQLDFENDGVSETVLVYSVDHDVIVKALKFVQGSTWSVAFEETQPKQMTPQDEFRIEKIRSTSGSDGVVVMHRHTGAGAATFWYVLANLKGQIQKLDPQPLRIQILNSRGYQDWGYNAVKVDKDMVIESLPGYSRKASRCCPDSPKIEVKFKFTGSAIALEGIR